jgi:hypothetical protein
MESHAIVISDTEGRIQHWNKGAERLFGYAAAEATGQSLDLTVPRAYRERHWQAFRTAMRTGECRLDRAATNLPVMCKDGTVRLFPARFVFLWDARNYCFGGGWCPAHRTTQSTAGVCHSPAQHLAHRQSSVPEHRFVCHPWSGHGDATRRKGARSARRSTARLTAPVKFA